MQRPTFLIAFLILLVACNMSDLSQELSGNYFYAMESATEKAILSHSGKRQSIYGEVLDYKYDNDFIVAMQRPDSESHILNIAFDLPDGDIAENLPEAKSILKSDPTYIKIFSDTLNYWIISHNHNKVFGPLTKPEFEKLHDSLGVDEDLNFD